MIESNHRKSKSVALKILHMDRVKKSDVGDLTFEVCIINAIKLDFR